MKGLHFMFCPGDIVEFVDRSGFLDGYFERIMSHIEDGEWFIIKGRPGAGGTGILVDDQLVTLFPWRFKLIARKTKFGYIVI
jgi:hypothetical protein